MDMNRANQIDGFDRTRPKAFKTDEVIVLSSDDECDVQPRNQHIPERPIKTETVASNQCNESSNFEQFSTVNQSNSDDTTSNEIEPNLIEPNSSLGQLSPLYNVDAENDIDSDDGLFLDYTSMQVHKQNEPKVQHSFNTSDLKRKLDATPLLTYQESTINETPIQYSTASTSCNSSFINEATNGEQSFQLQNSFRNDSSKENAIQRMFEEMFGDPNSQQQAKQQKHDIPSQQRFTELFDQQSQSANFQHQSPPNNNPPQNPMNTNDSNDLKAMIRQNLMEVFQETMKNFFDDKYVLVPKEEMNQLKQLKEGHRTPSERESSSSKHKRRHNDREHGRHGHSSHSHRSDEKSHRNSGSINHRSSRSTKHSTPLKVNKVEKMEKQMPTSSTSTATSIGYQTLDDDITTNYSDNDNSSDSDFEPTTKKSIYHTFLTSGKFLFNFFHYADDMKES